MWDEKINGGSVDHSKETEKTGTDRPELNSGSSSPFTVAGNMDSGREMSSSADAGTGEKGSLTVNTCNDNSVTIGNTSGGNSTGADSYRESVGTGGYTYENTFRESSTFGQTSYNSFSDSSSIGSGSSFGSTAGIGSSSYSTSGTGSSAGTTANTGSTAGIGSSSYSTSGTGSSAGTTANTGSTVGASASASTSVNPFSDGTRKDFSPYSGVTTAGSGSGSGAYSASGYGSTAGTNTGTGSGSGAYSASGYGSTAGTSAGSGSGTYSASGYGSTAGTSSGSGTNPGYRGPAGTSAGSGSNPGYRGPAGTTAGSGSNPGYRGPAGTTAGTGSGPNRMYSGEKKQESAGGNKPGSTGHYYNYNNRGDSGRTGIRNDGGKKKNNRLAVIVAVIIVFVLGAGMGSYISGRGSSASAQSSISSSKDKEEGKVKTGSANEKNTGEQETGGSSEKDAEQDGKTEDTSDITELVQETILTENSEIDSVEKVDEEAISANNIVAEVAQNVMPAIVSVYNKYTEEAQFFGHTYTQESESAGSGIIIGERDDELLIVTNNHVVEGADSLSVQFIDEQNCEAALKGTDAASDLAVIAVKVSDLSEQTRNEIAIAILGDSNDLRIGEQVIAIGNALGYGQSVTAGYVSALNREFSEEDGITGTFIQTDAAINPGNSGGALLDAEGQVVGINSNKIGGDSVEGMGFAIPISKAIPIINNLKEQESKTKVAEEERGVLGIYGISVTSDVASAYGMPIGAYVEEIIEGSGAANSELNQGDVITAINGTEVTSMESLSTQMSYYTAGSEVTLTVQHPVDGGNYEEREIKVTLSKSSDIQTQQSGNGEMRERGQEQEQYQEVPYEQGSDIFNFPFEDFGF